MNKSIQTAFVAISVLVVTATALFFYFQSTDMTKSKKSQPNDQLTFHTNKGDITMKILSEEAPTISKNFLDLAKAGKYKDTIFHRVIPGFMIQGGDYQNFNGTGGESFVGGYIEDEFSENVSHVRGMVSMANRGPNTNGSQFFIMHKDAPHLDGRHTIFAQVVEGMDVVDAITEVQRDRSDKPREDIVIEKISF